MLFIHFLFTNERHGSFFYPFIVTINIVKRPRDEMPQISSYVTADINKLITCSEKLNICGESRYKALTPEIHSKSIKLNFIKNKRLQASPYIES